MPVRPAIPVQRAGVDLLQRAAARGHPEPTRGASLEDEVVLSNVKGAANLSTTVDGVRLRPISSITYPGTFHRLHGPDALAPGDNLQGIRDAILACNRNHMVDAGQIFPPATMVLSRVAGCDHGDIERLSAYRSTART